ncbi:fimbria/pilus outer membrane usher protein [Escherichia coli]|uniref:fimbria/pilus outer membrane usher protein n=1 Tax=Escherichia coli TaxID=562 RepID=UPI00237BE359|nr:fimbria/pilus outer membrane usher protein [Escherichia coli]UMS28672.1 pilin outer membrane usher protein SafC [Escherichia coli]
MIKNKTMKNINILSYSWLAFAVMVACLTGRSGDAEGRTYSFDPSMLNGGGNGVDLTLFNEGGQLPGIYPVDIMLNGSWVDSQEMAFHSVRDSEGNPYLKTCLTRDMLARYGVRVEDYPGLFPADKGSGEDEAVCADLSAIPQSTETFHFVGQQLLLGIPQVALRPKLTGIAPEALWDDGIPAFLMNWQVNASRTEYRGYGQSENSDFWASLEPGLNVGPWRMRNLTTWNKQSGQQGDWETVYTRVERGLNGIKSRLVLGEHYTPSDVFDSVSFRGVMVGTDESMVPYNQREFAPVIRGISRTQARIEVRQNGYLIQSQTVAPGAFALTDLPLTGSGGDLQVTVLESDGTRQVFTVPFTTPAIALREGYLKYNVIGGQYRSSDSVVTHSSLGQITAMYGLPWGLTVFGGVQGAEHYQTGALGLGLSMGSFGAVSLDGIHAQGQKKGQDEDKGNTWRVRYNKSFELTGTRFTAASYQYSSDGYNTLSEVLDTYRDDGFRTYSNNDSRSRRTTLTLGQSFGGWGYLNLNANRDEYRDGKHHRDYVGASYGASWRDISWSVNWARNRNTGSWYGRRGRTEDSISFWMSVPLDRWLGGMANDIRATAQVQRSSGQNTRYETGLNGRAFDRQLYWDIRERIVPDSGGSADSSRLNLTWYGTYGEATGMYSYSNHLRQMTAGMSGGMIIHRNGVTLGQRTGETMALVEAPGVSGASVGGWPGVRTDFRGDTILGYTSPYQENVVTLDPTTFPADTEVLQTDSRVVPTKGAVVRAKFATRVGKRALVTLTRADGTPLPFGAVVTVAGETGKQVGAGVIGDRGEVYMSGLGETGQLVAQWGGNSRCHADYRLPDGTEPVAVFLTHSVCM